MHVPTHVCEHTYTGALTLHTYTHTSWATHMWTHIHITPHKHTQQGLQRFICLIKNLRKRHMRLLNADEPFFCYKSNLAHAGKGQIWFQWILGIDSRPHSGDSRRQGKSLSYRTHIEVQKTNSKLAICRLEPAGVMPQDVQGEHPISSTSIWTWTIHLDKTDLLLTGAVFNTAHTYSQSKVVAVRKLLVANCLQVNGFQLELKLHRQESGK